jgi:RimJ/RimL family protein N-acetyltransferase
MFAVEEKASGAVVGRVGPWEPEGWPDLEIGWTLRSDRWGRGYATEAATACLGYVFKELRRPHVISLILPDNTRSIRVAERIGETFEDTIRLPHVPERDILQYGLFREDWLGRVSQSTAS